MRFYATLSQARQLLVFALSLSASACLAAPANSPRIGYVYPAGGRQGSTFQVVLGGQFLNGATNVYFSGSGVTGKVIEHTRPMSQKEFNDLREKLQELQKKRVAARNPGQESGDTPGTNVVWTADDMKTAEELRRKLTLFSPRNLLTPAIAENVIVQVTASPDAAPGSRELRLDTALGLSNPLVFKIGTLPEVTMPAASRPAEGEAIPAKRRAQTGAVPMSEMNITLPCVVNGQIMPGGVDRFRFKARQGQRLVLAASARELIPYLADAVPGWFQASLCLYDAKGQELHSSDHFMFHPDPVLCYEIPRDGDYALEIRDSIYRGREDFVYRIAVGELPLVTSVFPLGGTTGSTVNVSLRGWNLPLTNRTVELGQQPGLRFVSVTNEVSLASPAPFACDDLPDRFEKEPNDSAPSAQGIATPVIINGRIDRGGDLDCFCFEGRAGESIVVEVVARRLNSPLDSVLTLTDSAGQKVGYNDDYEDKGSGLSTHHADSWFMASLPANGRYFIHLRDAQQQGGADYGYRLRVSAPRPDFALRAVPSSLSLRAGATVPITVYALRQDGFTNEISLRLKDSAAGFKLSGGRIPAGQDQVRLTLSAPGTESREPFSLALEGEARIQGETRVHSAVPAEDMMQAFIYRHLVPAKELRVAVSGRAFGQGPVKILGALPIKIPAGGTGRVELGVPAGMLTNRVELQLSDAPEGIALERVAASAKGTEVFFSADAKAKPGTKGNLILSALARRPAAKKGQPNSQRGAGATLPAIPYEIVSQ